MQKVIKDLFHQNPHLEKELEFHFFEAVDAKNNEHFAKFILEFKHCPYEFVRLMSLKNPKTKPIDKHFELRAIILSLVRLQSYFARLNLPLQQMIL